jgi:uncharacterized protein (DUF2141 family)
VKYIRLIIIPIIWFGACANPVPPSGGETDETPPALIEELSSPNLTTRFEAREFVLVFDEWIKLDKIQQQLIISPPLQHKPEIIHRGKSVRVVLHEDEELLDNTTYTFQFGEAIKDLNEGNAAEELKFVFSTGDIIDSLSLSGNIIDVITNEAVEGMKVMLYADLRDSIPLLERPIYIAKTNKYGAFRFSNLRSDTFRVIAINDDNLNYKFDPGKEGIAFLDTAIFLDQNKRNISLIRFEESAKISLSEKVFARDKITLAFSPSIDSTQLDFNKEQIKLAEWRPDSTILWLSNPLDSLFIYLDQGNEVDTLLLKKDRKAKKDTSFMKLARKSGKFIPQLESDSLVVSFNKPIVAIDKNGIFIYGDSLALQVDSFSFSNRELTIHSAWTQGEKFSLLLSPEAATGINGRNNIDTLKYQFKVPNIEKLGNIIFTNDSTFMDYTRLVHLYLSKDLIKEMVFRPNTIRQSFYVNALKPGKYEIEIIHDLNNNGKWDTGEYIDKRQPEPRYRKKLEPLRENWDLKVELQL